MISQRARRFFGSSVVCATTGLACASFGGMGMTEANAVDRAACPELGGAAHASFVADARANATIAAFVTASGDLAAVATRAEQEVGAACQRMANDLGVVVTVGSGESAVGKICGAVSARMDAILQQGASASIRADVVPPQCQVNVNEEASCEAACNVQVDPGYVKANCEPGHLYGRCEGTCSGRCDGVCNGECRGQCAGQAQANPGAASAAGRCAGQCQGTCNGSCSADCHGGCSVDFREPRCDVALRAPSADARCSGSCRAHANLTAQCTEARVNVRAQINTQDMGRLVATLGQNLPALVRAEVLYGQRIAGDVQVLVRNGSELPNAFGELTGHAAACLGAAANACMSAQASLSVSVQASASITARAGARGGA